MTERDIARWLDDRDLPSERADALASKIAALRNKKAGDIERLLRQEGFEREEAKKLAYYLRRRLHEKGMSPEQVHKSRLDYIRAAMDDERWFKTTDAAMSTWVDTDRDLDEEIKMLQDQSVGPEHCGYVDEESA